MADIQDYMNASRETDTALTGMRVLASQIEDHERQTNDPTYAILVALGFEAITAAIREVGTRMDYVLRDEMRRQARG